MIKQIAHICIHAADLQKTHHFYTEVLGLKVAFTFERKGEPFGYYFALGNNTFVEVFKGEPGGSGGIKHLAIEVEDMDGMIKRIRGYGVEIGEKKQGADHTWQVWLSDPNGTRIEFHEYTNESMQFKGGTCVVNW
jgi:catechol 2,3-dioxygenase-like lactoylglutathione lyase family enzyme